MFAFNIMHKDGQKNWTIWFIKKIEEKAICYGVSKIFSVFFLNQLIVKKILFEAVLLWKKLKERKSLNSKWCPKYLV